MAEAQLPHRVDATKLVEINQQFTAKIDQQFLIRLNEAVERCVTPVECEMVFQRDEERHRLLVGRCRVTVEMTCQRCLGTVLLEIESDFELGLVFNDEQAKQLPRRLEPVEMTEDGVIDLWYVMEDEVLLALPSFPMHPEDECRIEQPEPENDTDESPDEHNPFKVLAQLKQKN